MRYRHGGNRTPAAFASISHVGGETLFNVDQRDMGEHWIPLGAYVLDDESVFEWLHGPADGYLISDAVKVRGGWHDAANKAWWQMSAKEYVAYAAAPTSVTDYGDVSIRPAYAEYVGADAYISLHANAIGNTTSNGISTYRYSCQLYSDFSSSTGATNCDDPPGSTALLDEVQAAMIGSIHSDFDANFGNRNGRVANFGELRILDDTPGILIESGFFTNTDPAADGRRMSDNQALHDPRWREALVRGIAEGVARFLAPGSGLPPHRVDGLFAKNDGNNGLSLSWNAVDDAMGYHVFVSEHEHAFSDPVLVESGISLTVSDLPAGSLRFFKVAALNDNGEGWDSGVVTARTPPNAASHRLLVVDAYDRRDAWEQQVDNTFSISIEHGTALAGATDDVYFDGCLDEVLDDRASRGLSVDDYALIDFAAGKDSTEHQPISKTQQGILRAFVDGDGKLILSGEEVAFALMQSNDADDEAFLHEILHAEYIADDSNTSTFSGTNYVAFASLGDFQLSNGGDEGAYE
ncbi:MAG: hypothetical protein GY822_30515 [Deltaproteobacteria bacterium]|nr:hypothetical protein [Deltaproteobacteria bacterium]